jgi:hypothetical protein
VISYIEVPFKASLTVSGFKSFCLVLTVYTIDTFTNRDSLIDKNDCYVCMYNVLLQVLQFVSRDCVHVKYLYSP